MLKPRSAVLFAVLLVIAACASDDREEEIGVIEQPAAISGDYVPSSAALNAAAGVTINMSYPPPWTVVPSSCGGGPLPGTLKLSEYVQDVFVGVSDVGGYRCRQNTADLSQTSAHGTGWALDIHFPTVNGEADNTLGDPVANWLIANAGTLGVQYLIWDRTQYITSGTIRVSAYTGPVPHIDHIHVELAKTYAENANLPMPSVPGWQGSFDFTPSSNSVYGCTDSVVNYSCQNRQTVFQPGQNVNMVIKVNNVRRNVAFSIEAWRLGQSAPDWTWDRDPPYQVGTGWPVAYYLPRFDNVYAGDWEMRIFANTGSGPFQLTTFHFIVPGGSQQWPGSPYQYNGNSYHCKDGVTGGASTNWIYTCNGQQSSYTQGDIVSVMTRIDNVTSSHRFRARVFYNGSHLYTTNPSVWNDVPTGQTWQYAHFWTNISASAGSYEVRIDIDLPGGADFENVNVAIVPFTVSVGTPPPPYVYNGNNQTCANEPTGGQSTNWIYTCPNPTSTFSQGQSIRVFAFVENVRQSYYFRARFYRNGVYYNESITAETTVPSGQVWSRAYTWPGLWGAPSGSWRASLEIYTASSGWQMLQSNIPFTVLAPIGGYVTNTFKVCRGNPDNEISAASGVPVCSNMVPVTSALSPLSSYYWLLQFSGLGTNPIRFRIEAYNNGVYAWSWNFGPYAPVNGQAWFWPKFVNPGPGNWELLFFADIGGGFKQVEADTFFSL